MGAMLMTVLFLIAFAMLRNEVTHRIMQARIEEIHARNVALIDAGRLSEVTMDYDSELGSYVALMLNVRAWTLRQAFPRLPGASL